MHQTRRVSLGFCRRQGRFLYILSKDQRTKSACPLANILPASQKRSEGFMWFVLLLDNSWYKSFPSGTAHENLHETLEFDSVMLQRSKGLPPNSGGYAMDKKRSQQMISELAFGGNPCPSGQVQKTKSLCSCPWEIHRKGRTW